MVPATLENYLCWRRSAEATFELQGDNPEDVSASFATFGGLLEAPGAPENAAPVSAPASFCRNHGCRLRAVGSRAKYTVKHVTKGVVGEHRPNV